MGNASTYEPNTCPKCGRGLFSFEKSICGVCQFSDTNSNGVPVIIEDTRTIAPTDLPGRRTTKVLIGNMVPGGSRCKCGAYVEVNPDDMTEKPPTIIYSEEFKIIACPCCLIG